MTAPHAQPADLGADPAPHAYDALLVLSFGGPEGPADVIPFLRKVAEGRAIPEARLQEVAHHYDQFGGISPINAQNRTLIAALHAALAADGPRLPIYWGNRNWHPFLADTVAQMRADGVRRALVFVTSAYSSYSGCRQYCEDLERARAQVGEGAPQFDKLRVFYNHPGFIAPMVENTAQALARLPDAARAHTAVLFTAHSIPLAMAQASDYVAQLEEACRLVARDAGIGAYRLVYQSRSGPPYVPWLEPDICDVLRTLHGEGVTHAVLIPIGFISDHMEVLFDLDTEAQQVAADLGMTIVRAATVGTHPTFIAMLRELMLERMTAAPARRALGSRGPNHDICPRDCCLPGISAHGAAAAAAAGATGQPRRAEKNGG